MSHLDWLKAYQSKDAWEDTVTETESLYNLDPPASSCVVFIKELSHIYNCGACALSD